MSIPVPTYIQAKQTSALLTFYRKLSEAYLSPRPGIFEPSLALLSVLKVVANPPLVPLSLHRPHRSLMPKDNISCRLAIAISYTQARQTFAHAPCRTTALLGPDMASSSSITTSISR